MKSQILSHHRLTGARGLTPVPVAVRKTALTFRLVPLLH